VIGSPPLDVQDVEGCVDEADLHGIASLVAVAAGAKLLKAAGVGALLVGLKKVRTDSCHCEYGIPGIDQTTLHNEV
jgi:hypothetical protein